MANQPPFDQERRDPEEDRLVDRIVELQRNLHDKSGPKVKRAQHPKHHALCSARFVVEGNLPPHASVGLFAQPGDYPAWIRFSNGQELDDSAKGVRGAAVKVMGVDHLGGHEQDFLMIDLPAFFIADLRQYVAFFEALQGPSGSPIKYVFPGLNPFHWRLSALPRLSKIKRKRGGLLEIQYWSTTPYQLGEKAIKFTIEPNRELNGSEPPPGTTPDFLSERLAAHLKTKPAAFDFVVQIQSDREATPVEDPTVNWDAARPAPERIKVATLHLKVEDPTTPERLEMAQNTAFTPWHALPGHAPLGAINRARRKVYEALSHDRLVANGLSGPAVPSEAG